MFVIESAYGTPKASPVLNTDYFYLRLHDNDSFTGQMNPDLLDIPYGGGRTTPAVQVSDTYGVPFTLKSYLYPGAHSATLLKWCMGVIDTGRTVPWATTDVNLVMPPGDLASIGIYHAITLNDGTIDRRLYSGCKVHTWSLACSRADPRALLTISGSAIRDDKNAAGVVAYPDATEFPPPAETSYPQQPYLFSHTAGHLTIDTASAVRTQYSSVGITCTNAMDPVAFESNYLTLDKFCGRTATMTADMHLKVSPSDLALLQNKTVLNASLQWNNGTNSVTINFLAKNYFKSAGRSLPLNQHFRRTVSLQNFWDPVGAGDITLTAT
jgi:hypothetical protein